MSSERINIVGLDTVWGFKTIELYEGDISGWDLESDMLVVSAFANGYHPLPDTVLGDLKLKLGLDVRDEEKRLEYDFRGPLGLWISRSLTGFPFRRFLVLEMIGRYWPIEECITNAFAAIAALSAKGIEVQTLTMPILGAGHQKIPLSAIVPPLLTAAEAALRRHQLPERILFVEKNPARAHHLAEEMDRALRRTAVTLPHTEVLMNLRADLRRALDHSIGLVADGYKGLFDEARRIFDSGSKRSSEIGVIARSLVEFVVDDLLSRKRPSNDLLKKIDDLAQLGIAPWMRGYMHTLRILGNESAHAKSSDGRLPAHLTQEDLTISLFCLQRVLDFWRQHKSEKK
jgi:hypothetical protein